MSHHPSSSMSFPGRPGRAVGICKSLLLFALAIPTLGTGMCAFALTPTTTTFTITSAGSAVTTVPAQTVITLTATVKAGTTPLTVGQVNFCDATVAACTDIHLLGTAQLTSAGTAAIKLRPGVGSQSFKAVFSGTTGISGSSSNTASLTVTGGSATSTVFANDGSTATVYGSGKSAPGGRVSFV